MSEPLTADTITDEQIRELLVEFLYTKPLDSYAVDLADKALGRQSRYQPHDPARQPSPDCIRNARARCAEILNARKEGR